MGAGQSIISEEKLKEYARVTYLSKKEIIRAAKQFQDFARREDQNNDNNSPPLTSQRVSSERIQQMQILAQNPFKDRIVMYFCEESRIQGQSNDSTKYMTFDEFLDMFSVFSLRAPVQVKINAAFNIYDMDDDDFIGREDLECVIKRLVGHERPEMDPSKQAERDEFNAIIPQIIDNIMDESCFSAKDHKSLTRTDDETDEARKKKMKISHAEFEHVISKSPDFMNTFRLRI